MKVLITGGSGFIGTNMIAHFLRKNYTVMNVDIVQPKLESHAQYWHDIDIRNYERFSLIVKKFNPDYVLHLAARTDLNGKSLEDYDTNTLGTYNVINACKKIDSVKRVIFASSMLVNRVGYKPINFADYNPDNIYGESKVRMEKMILESNLNSEWLIIRPTSLWGPWFGEPYSNFFYFVIKGLFVHPGDRACTKTYGFIDNSVFQISTLLFDSDKAKIDRKTFYIGDEPAIDISDWADEISVQYSNKMNKKVYFWVFKVAALIGDFLKLIHIKFPITSFRLKNMTTDNILPLEDLYSVVGNNPFTRLDGTKKTLKWIMENKGK